MKTYNKLVRDYIPNIIRKEGNTCETQILEDKEFLFELKRKLIEESTELLEAKSFENTLEELADIYEVLEAILMEEKIDLFDIQKERVFKNRDKGAFEDKVFLKRVGK